MELFLANPQEANIDELVAQVLDEEEKRQRFSDNENVEAAHREMKEFSEEAAAEFRRVVSIMGEDANLDEITRKIRDKLDAVSATVHSQETGTKVPADKMTAVQIMGELRKMGFQVSETQAGLIIKGRSITRYANLSRLSELANFLEEQRSQETKT